MGRIKTKLVKGVTHKLVETHGEEFNDNFEDNKNKVSELSEIPSKKIRNIIAGYITRMKKRGA